MATPYATLHLDSAASTQDEARHRFQGKPLLVIAATQTAGRGRHGRTWLTAPRALAASLALTPTWPEAEWPRLTLVAGLAAASAASQDVGLDWPNDIVIGDDKVGGLLTEAGDGVVVFGLGLNLWWPQPPPGMAALLDADPGDAAAAEMAGLFADDLLERLDRGPDDWGHAEYTARCVTIGGTVEWEDGVGDAIAIAADGALVVQSGDSVVHLHSAEVQHIRRSTVPPMRPPQ